MTRSMSAALAPIVEQLELEQPEIVTLRELTAIAAQFGIATAPALIAHRLRERGWLLSTGINGAWEFAPGAHAGPHSRGGLLIPVRAALALTPDLPVAMALNSAAWAYGIADRQPQRTRRNGARVQQVDCEREIADERRASGDARRPARARTAGAEAHRARRSDDAERPRPETEEHDLPESDVVRHGVEVVRLRRPSRLQPGPGRAVPFPGLRQDHVVAQAAVEHDPRARLVVDHGVAEARSGC